MISATVTATWDDEAKVYHSDSNVPGLVVEAADLGEFFRIAGDLIPDLLAWNTLGGVVRS